VLVVVAIPPVRKTDGVVVPLTVNVAVSGVVTLGVKITWTWQVPPLEARLAGQLLDCNEKSLLLIRMLGIAKGEVRDVLVIAKV
jgi:hypothetical protein